MSDQICIIGSGVSGIAAGRALKQAGLPYVCYEAGSKPGGLWWLDNDNGMSNIYESLHTNTSSRRTGFSDMPMPESYPDFPHHEQVQQYLERYIRNFGLAESIQTGHTVERVEPTGQEGYLVTVRPAGGGPRREEFGSVIVCNGHHWEPFVPELPGQFDGGVIHSSEYRSPAGFEGKRVLVVGAGNSACDIAVDLTQVADVTMSTRSGAYVIPRYLLGRPLDLWSSEFISRFPIAVQRFLFRLLVWIHQGRQARFGFPTPASGFLTSHPTISSHVLDRVKEGSIKVRRGISKLDGDHVRFRDGAPEPFDVIVLATGYSVSFPFFDRDFVDTANNEIPLYNYVVHPEHENLYFIGLIQPLGALAPLAEAQARWVAALLSGVGVLPDRDAMMAAIERDHKTRDKLFTQSRRHTLEVEFFGYLRRLKSALPKDHRP